MDYYNGHPVLRNVPGPLITYAGFIKKGDRKGPLERNGGGGDEHTVMIEIDHPNIPHRKAYLYMGTYCCKYPTDTGKPNPKTDWEKSVYDVLMIDDSYILFTEEKYKSVTFYGDIKEFAKYVPTEIELTREEAIVAIIRAAENYRKHPVKPKGGLFRKPNDYDRKKACPWCMINPYDTPEILGQWE